MPQPSFNGRSRAQRSRVYGRIGGQAMRMASGKAARALGFEGELGLLALGYRASFTGLGHDLRAETVIVDGVLRI